MFHISNEFIVIAVIFVVCLLGLLFVFWAGIDQDQDRNSLRIARELEFEIERITRRN